MKIFDVLYLAVIGGFVAFGLYEFAVFVFKLMAVNSLR